MNFDISIVQAFISGFDDFLIQLGVALGLFAFAVFVYVILTPHKEIRLIQEGNASAALAFGGIVLGLAIPMGSCLAHSLGLIDLAIWGAVSLLLQLIAFRFVDLILHGLPRRIAEGDVAAALVVVSVKVGIGLIMAGALSDPSLGLFRSAAAAAAAAAGPL